MKLDRRAVASLLMQALEPGGWVRLGEEDEVHVRLEEGSPVTFHLLPWQDALPLDAFQGGDPLPGRPLWVMEEGRPRELARIRERGESFVAMDGAVRVQAPGILVDRTDLPDLTGRPARPRRSAFTDRASLIPRVLFASPPSTAWNVSALARAADVSLSVASYAVGDLEERGLVRVEKKGREKRVLLEDPRALVEAWAGEYDWRDNHSLAIRTSIESVRRFLFRLRGELSEVRWGVTLHAGASVLATRAPVEAIDLYLDLPGEAELWKLARDRGWTPAREGALRLWLPHYRRSVWYGSSDNQGVPLVSPLQLILDLWSHPREGRATAEELLALAPRDVIPPEGPPPDPPGSPSGPGEG